MSAKDLVELDSLEILVIVDNELDPISKYGNEGVTASGNLADLAMRTPFRPNDRGENVHEVRMEQICQSAHGLAIMLVGRLVLLDPCSDVFTLIGAIDRTQRRSRANHAL
jgi:hypothetical protein